ncbi:hypothetical protein D3C83_184670 [compost metagenome]
MTRPWLTSAIVGVASTNSTESAAGTVSVPVTVVFTRWSRVRASGTANVSVEPVVRSVAP